MKSWFAWARRVLSRIFARTEIVEPAPQRSNRKPRTKPGETYGAYYYLDSVLDDLDDYFEALRLMRSHDPEGFDLYSRVGAQVIARSSLLTWQDMPSVWSTGERPATGMMHFTGAHDTKDLVCPSFLSFKKLGGARQGVQVTNGDLYEITLFWRDKKKHKGMLCGTYHLGIDAEGGTTLLREKMRSVERDIPSISWRYPFFIVDMAKEHKEPPAEYAAGLFRLIVGAVEHAATGVQVRARKGNIAAIFNVDMLRTPYFFKDRDKTVTENGRTKRIFHITRAHRRITAGGAVSFVKSHFRGERRFAWNGYAVTITMPGLHHSIWQRFTARAYDDDGTIKGLNAAQLGARIDRHMAS